MKILPSRHLIMYADNSPAQNKNNAIISFFTWLVKINKRYPSITINYMVSGHTKFSPDGHFGRIKAHLRNNNCFSILDLIGEEGVIKTSSSSNIDIPDKDPHTGTHNFKWMD